MTDNVPYPPRDQHEEFANALTHAAGVVLSVAGGVALLLCCSHWTVAVACGLYALTLVATYAASALSHGVRQPDWKHLLSIWDQGVIYERPDRPHPLRAAQTQSRQLGGARPRPQINAGRGQWRRRTHAV